MGSLDVLVRGLLHVSGKGVSVISVCPGSAAIFIVVVLNDSVTYQVQGARISHQKVVLAKGDIHQVGIAIGRAFREGCSLVN